MRWRYLRRRSFATCRHPRRGNIGEIDIQRSLIQWRRDGTGVRGLLFFFSSRRRHTRFDCDWSSDVCSSDLGDFRYFGGGDGAKVGKGRGVFPVVIENIRVAALPVDNLMSHQFAELLVTHYEIGRASCRERV